MSKHAHHYTPVEIMWVRDSQGHDLDVPDHVLCVCPCGTYRWVPAVEAPVRGRPR
jgi:hypothetical protein